MIKPLIVVGTPCFGGLVAQDYTMSLLSLAAAAQQAKFDMAVVMLGNDALITRGRSAIVARFLDMPGATHLLFVDSDISFDPAQVVRMLRFDKDFVAGLYPAKVIDWQGAAERFHPQGEGLDEAGLRYVGDLCVGAEARREDGFATATYAGTGFQLIKRGAFERMIAAYPETQYSNIHAWPPQGGSDNLYALFDCVIDKDTGAYLSEDFAFCRRWRAIGGEIWLDLQSRLNHCGPYTYRGNAAARFG
ncbi:MAG: hypothetical protein ABTQ34_04685 [Bdellovibrionales bacterium]